MEPQIARVSRALLVTDHWHAEYQRRRRSPDPRERRKSLVARATAEIEYRRQLELSPLDRLIAAYDHAKGRGDILAARLLQQEMENWK